MHYLLYRYKRLAKRWAWLVALAVIFCGCATLIVSIVSPPEYQASADLFVSVNSSSSPSDNINASQLAVPTYALLITNSSVLQTVVAHHAGLTIQQLSSMITVNPQSNTQLIQLYARNNDPQLAMQLANEVSQSFVQFMSAQLLQRQTTIHIIPAKLPTAALGPGRMQKAALGALAGLGLSLTFITVFEYIDDLPQSPEEVQALLDLEVLADIPQPYLKGRAPTDKSTDLPGVIEGCHLLDASLTALGTVNSFKSLMITSTVANEGKSTIAIRFATTLARSGKSVLLVDANLRHPILGQHFLLDDEWGLADVLLGNSLLLSRKLSDQVTEIQTLRILPAGKPGTNPAELFESSQAKEFYEYLKVAPFDYIILDAAPLLSVADAQILAAHVDMLLVVADVSKTPRRKLRQVKRALDQISTPIAGVVINKSYWGSHEATGYNVDHKQDLEDRSTMPIPTFLPKTNGDLVDKLDGLAELDATVSRKTEP